jgi:hypothetical protein
LSKLSASPTDWIEQYDAQADGSPSATAEKSAAWDVKALDVNFALTIGMLKLRRRLRSTRPSRRPGLDWEVLHIPVTPCLMGWRERIRR